MTGKLHKTFLSQLTQRKVMRVALAYIVIGWREYDSDLDSIRDHPRYAGIIASITDNATIMTMPES